MCNITIISSFHKNYGKCNPNELLKIIESFKPEVIFEELDKKTFRDIYVNANTPVSNEAIAISYYLKKHPIEHIPVDTYQFDFNKLFSGAEQISLFNQEYSNLWKQHASFIKKFGYEYLNSDDCSKIIQRIKKLEQNALVGINDKKLSNSYDTEFLINEKRELEMLKNIYDHCMKSPTSKGIFICGVHHIHGFKEKLTDFKLSENINIEWNFFIAK